MSHAVVAWGQLPVCPSAWHDGWRAAFLRRQGFPQIGFIGMEFKQNADLMLVSVFLSRSSGLCEWRAKVRGLMWELGDTSPLTSSQQKYPGVTWCGRMSPCVSPAWWRPMKRLLFLGRYQWTKVAAVISTHDLFHSCCRGRKECVCICLRMEKIW